MRLNKIRSRNYRALEDIEIYLLSNYCTISGHNNARKSCIIRLISGLLYGGGRRPWLADEYAISYQEDKTQWVKDDSNIELSFELELTREENLFLIAFM